MQQLELDLEDTRTKNNRYVMTFEFSIDSSLEPEDISCWALYDAIQAEVQRLMDIQVGDAAPEEIRYQWETDCD